MIGVVIAYEIAKNFPQRRHPCDGDLFIAFVCAVGRGDPIAPKDQVTLIARELSHSPWMLQNALA
jgi:hypothetical protein